MAYSRSKSPGVVGIVYLIENSVNGKKYVGQTIASVEERWSKHRHAAKKGSMYAIHRAIRKYGEANFTISTIREVRGTFEDLLEAEKSCIVEQQCMSPAGYNLSEGGEGIDFFNPVIKKRHAEAVRKVSSRDSWRAAQFEGAQKRLADPEWQRKNAENLAKMHADPEWQNRHAEHLAKMHNSPTWLPNLRAGIQRRSVNPVSVSNHKAAMEKMHANPEYRENMRKVHRDLALARDALLPPEGAARRASRRARYAVKKGIPL